MTVRDGSLVGRRAGWVAAGAAALFVPLAVLARVDEGLLLRIDRPVNRAMLDLREPWLDPVMKAVSYLGSRWTVAGVLVALSLWSLVTGRARVTVLAMLLTYALTLGLQVLLKEVLV
ncbi:MAG: hypothetical protein HY658_14120, partial [Actinobacteria bacterium]|nr:hypothetical protein [Actinomycetota bacterium]